MKHLFFVILAIALFFPSGNIAFATPEDVNTPLPTPIPIDPPEESTLPPNLEPEPEVNDTCPPTCAGGEACTYNLNGELIHGFCESSLLSGCVCVEPPMPPEDPPPLPPEDPPPLPPEDPPPMPPGDPPESICENQTPPLCGGIADCVLNINGAEFQGMCQPGLLDPTSCNCNPGAIPTPENRPPLEDLCGNGMWDLGEQCECEIPGAFDCVGGEECPRCRLCRCEALL